MVNTSAEPPHLQGHLADSYALEVDIYNDRAPADNAKCEMCGARLGYISGDAEYRAAHVTYYAVHLPGDAYDTQFCEDCIGWLADAAPVITAAADANFFTAPSPSQGDPS